MNTKLISKAVMFAVFAMNAGAYAEEGFNLERISKDTMEQAGELKMAMPGRPVQAAVPPLRSFYHAESLFNKSALPARETLLGDWKLVSNIADDPIAALAVTNYFIGDPLLRVACKEWNENSSEPCAEYSLDGVRALDGKVKGIRFVPSRYVYSETGLDAVFVGYRPALTHMGDIIPSGDIGPVDLRFIQGIEASNEDLYARRFCRALDQKNLICKVADSRGEAFGYEGFVKSER